MASAFGLHPNLVSDAVRELIREEWVIESGPKKVGAGRSPISLQLHPEKRASFAASYDPRSLICALINADGKIIRKVEQRHAAKTPERLVNSIAGVYRRMEREFPGHVIGVGVADPGMVDSAKGEVVRSSIFPEWRNVPVARLLERQIGETVFLEDSTRTRAAAQYRITLELHQKRDAMLYLDYGIGLGFALVTQEGIWRGAGFANELGHVILEPSGPPCRCGASGCLESLVGSFAMESKAKELLAQGVTSSLQGRKEPTAEAIFKAALDGDRMARRVTREIMPPLGVAVAFVVTAFHPRFLVIGAESGSVIEYLYRELKTVIENQAPPEIAASVEIVAGKESRPLALIGAGLMVFEKNFMRNGNRAFA